MTTGEQAACPYDAYYFAHDCGRPYQRDDVWLGFFGLIADRVIAHLAPRTVLDAGCAMGFLVESLRDRGVEAYGLDLSPYAIARVRPDMQPYCRVASVTEPLGRVYDLIVCIEVLEHLSPEDAERAIANLCSHADQVLFSSTPDDFGEATHINVRQPEYWAEMFALHGFYRDMDFDAGFITHWAGLFRKTGRPAHTAIRAYERALWQAKREIAGLRTAAGQMRDQLSEQERLIQELRGQAVPDV